MTRLETLSLPDREAVARRAYEIYERNGRVDGHDRDNWLQAEYELVHLPLQKLATLPPQQVVSARKSSALLQLVSSVAAL